MPIESGSTKPPAPAPAPAPRITRADGSSGPSLSWADILKASGTTEEEWNAKLEALIARTTFKRPGTQQPVLPESQIHDLIDYGLRPEKVRAAMFASISAAWRSRAGVK